MKYILICFVFCANIVLAQVPQSVGFQMVVRDNSGVLIAKKRLGIRISILQGSVNGAVLYQEFFLRMTNANGFVFFPVGQGSVLSGKFSTIDWSAGIYFIKSEIDPFGGENYSIIGTSQLLSVPYAMYAAHATYDSLLNLPPLNTTKINEAAHDSLKALIAQSQRHNGLSDSVVVDVDGNVYTVVKIGEQYWMKDNLRATHFNDGVLIPNLGGDWNLNNNPGFASFFGAATIGGSLKGSGDNMVNLRNGLLYNHNVVVTDNVCPIGWHIPSDADFVELETFLGGPSIAGGKMKGSEQWNSPNTGATNSSGFSAIGAGTVSTAGLKENNGVFAVFWTTSSNSPTLFITRMLSNNSSVVQKVPAPRNNGFSIRCVRN
jgi:uncharacterized protein (TIGR02145 family)